MSRIYKTAFAATGDIEVLADTDPGTGKVSLPSGWTSDYEKEDEDPNYRPVGRKEMNGILNEVTGSLGEMQLYGFAPWRAITGGWPIGARVQHDGVAYLSLVANNSEEPGASATEWELWGLSIATTAAAQAMVDDETALTPKKLADAFKGSNQSLAANALQVFPGGLIIQAGVGNINGANSGPVVFPFAFPNAAIAVVPIKMSNLTPDFVTPDEITKTGFNVYGWRSGSATPPNAFRYLAVGY